MWRDHSTISHPNYICTKFALTLPLKVQELSPALRQPGEEATDGLMN